MTVGTTFIGHLLPGLFFTIFSLWWIVCILQRFKRAVRRGRLFQASATYRLTFSLSGGRDGTKIGSTSDPACFFNNLCCVCAVILTRLPVEGVIKLIAASIGSLGELATGWDPAHQRFRPSGSQHVTMYFLYGISGLADILVFCRAYFVPRNFDYIGIGFAVGGESLLLFANQAALVGNPVKQACHQLLFFSIFGCFLLILLEQRMADSLCVALARAYALLLHGTWFIATGFILAPPWAELPEWNLLETENILYIVAEFCWIGIILLLALVAIAAYTLSPIRDILEAKANKIDRESLFCYRNNNCSNINGTIIPNNNDSSSTQNLLTINC